MKLNVKGETPHQENKHPTEECLNKHEMNGNEHFAKANGCGFEENE